MRLCLGCGQNVRYSNGSYCYQCWKERKPPFLCKDCGIKISKPSVRCSPCSSKARAKQGVQTTLKPQHSRSRYQENHYNQGGANRKKREFLLKCQGGVCAICGTDRPTTSKTTGWCLDHDHITREIRGVLCSSCNSNVRQLDDPAYREKVLAYLSNPPAMAVYREVGTLGGAFPAR